VSDADLVFDLVGGDTQQRPWQVLRRGGALVSTLNESVAPSGFAVYRSARTPCCAASVCEGSNGNCCATITRTPPSSIHSPIFEAERDALACVEQGHVRGKVVIKVADY
jgi:hypothetical protein